MCGFFLYIERDSSSLTLQREKVDSLLELGKEFIDVRGPTYSTFRVGRNFFAYQSVLAIQTDNIAVLPAESPLNGPAPFLYNGEIFSSSTSDKRTSDTDILKRHVEHNTVDRFLKECDGMYVLASLSISNDYLEFCDIYRDLMGEKHLWYYSDNSVFLCSTSPGLIVSYLKRLLLDNLNLVYIHDYFSYRHSIDPINHFFEGIKQLAPGRKLAYKTASHGITLTVYSSLEDLVIPCLLHEKRSSVLLTMVSNVLEGALQKMQAVNASHVSTAAIFSGGIDSSLVSALLGNIDKNIPTYTLCFKGKDTAAFASKDMARYISMNNTQIEVSVSDYYEALIASMYHLGSPVNSHSLPSSLILSKIVRDEKHHIVYGGEGADEIFMGYSTYSDYTRKLSEYSGNYYKSPGTTKRLQTEWSLSCYIEQRYRYYYDFFSDLGLDATAALTKSKSMVDTEIQLPSVGLLSSDTVTAISGIEGRTPFTRKSVVSIGLSLHPDFLVRSNKPVSHTHKYPLSVLFNHVFGDKFSFPKEGYAGFPNECDSFLGPSNQWQILSLLNIKHTSLERLSRACLWKIINIELFLSVVSRTMYR